MKIKLQLNSNEIVSEIKKEFPNAAISINKYEVEILDGYKEITDTEKINIIKDKILCKN